MTAEELNRETSAFQCGYWDGFVGAERPDLAPFEWPSYRLDYFRGFDAGRLDFSNDR